MNEVIFEPYTQEEASRDGIGWEISNHSLKAVKNEAIIGKLIFEDKPIKIPGEYILKQPVEIQSWYNKINNIHTICLRNIFCEEKERYSGFLEDMFDRVVFTSLPKHTQIWAPNIVPRDILYQLGFQPPKYPFKNNSILVFGDMITS